MAAKTKLVVIDNHTLGYILPGSNYASVLHASVLRGAASGYPLSSSNPILLSFNGVEFANVRLASEKDFDDFRVHFGSFANKDEYEYQE